MDYTTITSPGILLGYLDKLDKLRRREAHEWSWTSDEPGTLLYSRHKPNPVAPGVIESSDLDWPHTSLSWTR